MTEEQEYSIVYDHLLAMAREVELDPTLKEYKDQIEKDLEEFQENYPEIVEEYKWSKQS